MTGCLFVGKQAFDKTEPKEVEGKGGGDREIEKQTDKNRQAGETEIET